MSDFTDDVMEGIFCQECGTYFPDCEYEYEGELYVEGPGYPRTCDDCFEDFCETK